jgi:uncharacterized protein (TIGR02757 family)
MDPLELKAFLDEKAARYNHPSFIATDPIQVPHSYSEKNDIEIAGFLTAIIAWGRKTSIVSSARLILGMMPGGPAEFITGAGEREFDRFLPFVHRTFNGLDCVYFLEALRRLYLDHGGPGHVFREAFMQTGDTGRSIARFRELFFQYRDPGRSAKHLPDVTRNSAAKRINMFLRWMVRRDNMGVDFGIWNGFPMHALMMPLDVHSGTVARKLGLLVRRQNDWKAVEELTGRLREFDPADPVRYDFALFGLGSFEGF